MIILVRAPLFPQLEILGMFFSFSNVVYCIICMIHGLLNMVSSIKYLFPRRINFISSLNQNAPFMYTSSFNDFQTYIFLKLCYKLFLHFDFYFSSNACNYAILYSMKFSIFTIKSILSFFSSDLFIQIIFELLKRKLNH